MHKLYIYISLLLFIGKIEAQNSFKDILDNELKTTVDIMSKDYVFSGHVKLYKHKKNIGQYTYKMISTSQGIYSENRNGFVIKTKKNILSCFHTKKVMVYKVLNSNSSQRKDMEHIANELSSLIDSVAFVDKAKLSFKRVKENNQNKVVITSQAEDKVITYIFSIHGHLKGIRIDAKNEIYDYLYMNIDQLTGQISKSDLTKLNLDTYLDKKRHKLIGQWSEYNLQKH